MRGAPASPTGLGSAEAPEPHSGLRPAGAIPRAARGFGGRTFSADGRTIYVEPSEVRKEDGRTNVSLGFPFATLEEYVDPDSIASDLAEYLSCPKRAAAPEMFGALLESCLALETLARRVFNDNGDHTIDTAPLDADVFSACYYAAQTVRAALAKARGEQ